MAAQLTEKQRRFCDEYLIDLNATRAYKAAYLTVKKDETAAAAAARLLKNVKVKAYLEERIRERQKRTEITQDRVLREIAAIAFADIGDIVSVSGGAVCLANTNELPEEKRKMISGIKEGREGVEVKMYDRLRALELLGRHLGMFDERRDREAQEPITITFAGTEDAAR